jgi:hypothetical protein
VADDVRAWLEDRPIAARPVGALERAALFVRRRPSPAAAYVLTAAVVVRMGFGGSLAWPRQAAEKAGAEAVVARVAETDPRAEADRQHEQFARFEFAYGRMMQVAHQEWRDRDVHASAASLDDTRLDFRAWEWRYVERGEIRSTTLRWSRNFCNVPGVSRLYRVRSGLSNDFQRRDAAAFDELGPSLGVGISFQKP